jgi:hypothetical protein
MAREEHLAMLRSGYEDVLKLGLTAFDFQDDGRHLDYLGTRTDYAHNFRFGHPALG